MTVTDRPLAPGEWPEWTPIVPGRAKAAEARPMEREPIASAFLAPPTVDPLAVVPPASPPAPIQRQSLFRSPSAAAPVASPAFVIVPPADPPAPAMDPYGTNGQPVHNGESVHNGRPVHNGQPVLDGHGSTAGVPHYFGTPPPFVAEVPPAGSPQVVATPAQAAWPTDTLVAAAAINDVIDLREPSPASPPIFSTRVDAPAEPAPTAPPSAAPAPPTGTSDRLKRRRRLVVLVLLAVAALWPLDILIGQVVHDQRQRHLAFDATQPKEKLSEGDAVMVLQIPSIDFNEVVAEGTSPSVLRGGPGRVSGTGRPGGQDNIVVAGKRRRYGGPFSELGTLVKGAQIAVRLRTGQTDHFYTVDSVKRVPIDDPAPFRATKGERLTLITDAGGLFSDERVVVVASPTAAGTGTKLARYRPVTSDLETGSSSLVGVALLTVLLAAIVAVAVLGGRELRRRYERSTVIAVAAPVLGLLLLGLLFAVDLILPSLS